MEDEQSVFSHFLKTERSRTGLSQKELAAKSGVGLRFIRDLEQGKKSLRLDKLNQVLALFGAQAGPVELKAREKNDA
jgi:y4mF family transcriptional regulator